MDVEIGDTDGVDYIDPYEPPMVLNTKNLYNLSALQFNQIGLGITFLLIMLKTVYSNNSNYRSRFFTYSNPGV